MFDFKNHLGWISYSAMGFALRSCYHYLNISHSGLDGVISRNILAFCNISVTPEQAYIIDNFVVWHCAVNYGSELINGYKNEENSNALEDKNIGLKTVIYNGMIIYKSEIYSLMNSYVEGIDAFHLSMRLMEVFLPNQVWNLSDGIKNKEIDKKWSKDVLKDYQLEGSNRDINEQPINK